MAWGLDISCCERRKDIAEGIDARLAALSLCGSGGGMRKDIAEGIDARLAALSLCGSGGGVWNAMEP